MVVISLGGREREREEREERARGRERERERCILQFLSALVYAHAESNMNKSSAV